MLPVVRIVVPGPDGQEADVVRFIVRLRQDTIHYVPSLDHLDGGLSAQHGNMRLRELLPDRPDRRGEHDHIADALIHHDQDPVYTGYEWARQIIIKDKARLSFAKAGARENPVMESFFGKFKTENKSLFLDCQTIEELRKVVKERILYCNMVRRHSSLGQISPMRFIKNYRKTPYQK